MSSPDLTPIEKGGYNENFRVVSPKSVPTHLKYAFYVDTMWKQPTVKHCTLLDSYC